MKKVMIACAAVALAAVAQAASIDWAIGGNTWFLEDGTSTAAKGTTVYLIDAAQWSTIEAAVKGGKDTFTTADAGILGVAATSNTKGAVSATATSSQLTAGQSYDYAYLVILDDKYFASGTSSVAAYDPTDANYAETQSITFEGAHSSASASLSGGWADVSSSDVPEPTSGLLLLLGVAGLALKRKRA